MPVGEPSVGMHRPKSLRQDALCRIAVSDADNDCPGFRTCLRAGIAGSAGRLFLARRPSGFCPRQHSFRKAGIVNVAVIDFCRRPSTGRSRLIGFSRRTTSKSACARFFLWAAELFVLVQCRKEQISSIGHLHPGASSPVVPEDQTTTCPNSISSLRGGYP